MPLGATALTQAARGCWCAWHQPLRVPGGLSRWLTAVLPLLCCGIQQATAPAHRPSYHQRSHTGTSPCASFTLSSWACWRRPSRQAPPLACPSCKSHMCACMWAYRQCEARSKPPRGAYGHWPPLSCAAAACRAYMRIAFVGATACCLACCWDARRHRLALLLPSSRAGGQPAGAHGSSLRAACWPACRRCRRRQVLHTHLDMLAWPPLTARKDLNSADVVS
jgi:hypothetical protein